MLVLQSGQSKRWPYDEPPVRETVLLINKISCWESQGRKQSPDLQAVNVLPFALGT